jgi:uncharacterized protein YyaL (SSP411 family)
LLLVFLLGQVIPAAAAEINWAKDFQSALAKAKAEKKPILLEFYGTR